MMMFFVSQAVNGHSNDISGFCWIFRKFLGPGEYWIFCDREIFALFLLGGTRNRTKNHHHGELLETEYRGLYLASRTIVDVSTAQPFPFYRTPSSARTRRSP